MHSSHTTVMLGLLLSLTTFPIVSVSGNIGLTKHALTGCAILGYPKATLNECGYCVGDGTGLDPDFGKDCLGQCNGKATPDCFGVCNGPAYRDECTGDCFDDSLQHVIEESENGNGTTRDCRGVCSSAEVTPSQYAYRKDECGVCRLQANQASPSIDCTGKCQPPGAPRSREECGQCVGPSPASRASVFDDCGNCLNRGIFCSCEKDPSLCGCVNTDSCLKVKSVFPMVVPKLTQSKVLLIGYFYPVIDDLHCLFQHHNSGEVVSTLARFVENNKTSIECTIALPKEGIWYIGLRFPRNGKDAYESNPLILIAYDRIKARFSSMAPAETLTTEFKTPITLHFNGPSMGSMPAIPLKCKIKYDEDKALETIATNGDQPFTCVLPPTKRHRSSQTLFVTPTFDGINPLSHPFTFTIIAPHPSVSHQTSFISSDGLSIIIMFERPVDVSHKEMRVPGLSLCTYCLTGATLQELNVYDLASCVWSSKVQFMVYLSKPVTEASMDITFKAGLLKEDSQPISHTNESDLKVVVRKLTTEWWSYSPKLIITGPSEIPRCGVFALTGHYSSPQGSTGVAFKWTVRKDGDGKVGQDLSLLVEGLNRQNLILDAILLELGANYQFTLQAVGENSEQSLTAVHRLVRFNYDAPIVSVYSNIMLPAAPLDVNHRAIFWAETYVPICVFPFQKVGLFWKVIDPKVRFNFSLAYSPVYVVAPYAIPEDHPVTFYLNAFLGHRINATSGAAFTVVAQAAPLRAIISGASPMVTVGSNSGKFSLSGEESQNGIKGKLVYQWSCVDSDTHQPCYFNFGSFNTTLSGFNPVRDYLLINRTLQKSPVLEFDSSQLEPNRELIFALQVFDGNSSKKVSETELTLVKVIKGNAPQVYMGAVYIKGVARATIRSPHNLAIVVPAHTPLVISGTVRAGGKMKIKSLKWDAPNFIHPLHWVTDESSGNEIRTRLHIHADYTFPYGFHVIKLIACNEEDICSEALTQFTASQGVTQCQLSIDSYVEYDLVTVTVEKCNLPPGYAPVNYQLFAADHSHPFPVPITVPQFSSVFIFPGSPPLSTSSQSITYGAQVCDSFEFCQMFYSPTVDVKSSGNSTADSMNMLVLAKRYNTAGDPVGAVSVIGAILRKTGQSSTIVGKAIRAAIEYIVQGLQRPSLILNKGQIAVAYNVLSEVTKKTDDPLLRRQALDAIHRITEKAKGWKVLPDLTTIESTLHTVLSSYQMPDNKKKHNTSHDPQVLYSIRETSRLLLQSVAAQVPLGTKTEFGKLNDEDYIPSAYSIVLHDIGLHDVTLVAKANASKTVEANISFGDELKKHFTGPWKCGKTQDCHSVVFSVTLYPNEGPFPGKRRSQRLSPIVDVTIYAPNTGEEQHIKGYLNAASLSVTLTGNDTKGGTKYLTRCHFWNQDKQMWDPDGVHSSGIANGKATCWTGHLTAFTVWKTRDGVDTGTIVGIVVAVLMGVLVIGMLVIFCIHKRQEAVAAKASAQQLVAHLR